VNVLLFISLIKCFRELFPDAKSLVYYFENNYIKNNQNSMFKRVFQWFIGAFKAYII